MAGIIILNPSLKNSTLNNEGINISKKITELGGKAQAYGIISGCAGYNLRDFMDQNHIHFEFVEILHKSINEDLDKFFSLLNKLSPFPEFWLLCGTLTSRLPENTFNLIIDFLNSKDAKCVLLTEGEALRLSLESRPFLIKLNKDQLNYIINKDLTFEQEIINAAKSLAHKSKYILISFGFGSAVLVGNHMSVYAVPEEDTKIEAGSSFIAAFLLKLEETKSIKEAFGFGLNYESMEKNPFARKVPIQADIKDMQGNIKVGVKFDDLVCGMEVEEDKSYVLETESSKFYFCSLICQEKFNREPEKYLLNKKYK